MTKSRLNGDEIIISNVGSCGATFLCPKLDIPMSLAPNAILVRTPNNHFYYHWFCSKFGQDAINKIVAKSAMPKFNKTEFRKILIPVPSAKEQARIADILDKFAVLTTSLSDGIPAEQAAQQKRYEYYRDKLLTFPMAEK
jgi:type I restriction enzyme S subunit